MFASQLLDDPAYLPDAHGQDSSNNKEPAPTNTHSLTHDGNHEHTQEKRKGIGGRVRRIMAAVAHPTRPQIRRNSPLAIHRHQPAFSAAAPALQSFQLDDTDSDDEPPPQLKFSKYTEAILGNERAPSSPPKQEPVREAPRFNRSVSANKAGPDTPSRAPHLKIVRKSSPSVLGHDRGNTPPRIVQIGGKFSGSGARSISISGPYPQRFAVKHEPTPEASRKHELVTPAPAPRALRVTRTRTGSNASQDGQLQSFSRPGSRDRSNSALDSHVRYASDLSRSASISHAPETVTRYGSSTMNRSRNASAEGVPPPGSQRVKRAPLGTGTFLGGKARRFKRRDGEDDISPVDDPQAGSASTLSHTPQDRSVSTGDGARSRSGSVNTRATSVEPVSVHDWASRGNDAADARPGFSRSQLSNDSRPGSRQASRERVPEYARQGSIERYHRRRRPSIPSTDAQPVEHQLSRSTTGQSQPKREIHDSGYVEGDAMSKPRLPLEASKPSAEPNPPQRAPSFNRAQYRYTAPKVHTDASEDQENMPPPTFKRNKDQEFKVLGVRSMTVLSDSEDGKPRMPVEETPVPLQPRQQERRALGTISNNTPHRPAPPAPPPKMSVLNTATATAGASVTKSKKKRSHIVVNGKIFTQMGKIGKGGSSDVYCVMAENYKTFALKRVKLSDCDESAVRGYKGEIDLLKKLTEVERVVRLFDWELNDEKKELCVLMEKGESDLNRLLTMRLGAVDARFDNAFVRYHWREMLECVQAVHEHDIVHSDLKPANFLLVQGRLKLIDFGIANAIETDHTVNVHRDSHVGTPNYMSPESITDTNAPAPGMSRDAAGRPLKKDMRIGKASDVWSLGCILYQMAYGRPPFAHIQNQITRIMAITNPKHIIEFPETGVEGRLSRLRCGVAEEVSGSGSGEAADGQGDA